MTEVKMRTDINELDYSYDMVMDTKYLNADGHLKLGSFSDIAVCLMDWHTTKLGAGNPDLMRRFGAAWALIYLEVRLHKAVKRGETLTGQTWCPKRKRSLYERDMVFKNSDGETVMTAGSLWTLIDVEKREMYTKSDVLEVMIVTDEESVCPDKKLRFRDKDLNLRELGTVTAKPSWTDGSGHVNNARYGEIAYDSLSKTDRDRIGELTKVEYFFAKEMSEGDEARVSIEEKEDRVTVVCDKEDGSNSFVCRISFT